MIDQLLLVVASGAGVSVAISPLFVRLLYNYYFLYYCNAIFVLTTASTNSTQF